MSQTVNKWKMTRDTTTGNYTLECKDSNFETQQKQIKVQCGNKTMTGDLVVDVKAKTGNCTFPSSISGTDATYSYDANNNILTLSKSISVEAYNFTKGWIESKPSRTINVSLQVGVNLDPVTFSDHDSGIPMTDPVVSVNGRHYHAIWVTAGKLDTSTYIKVDPAPTKNATITPSTSTQYANSDNDSYLFRVTVNPVTHSGNTDGYDRGDRTSSTSGTFYIERWEVAIALNDSMTVEYGYLSYGSFIKMGSVNVSGGAVFFFNGTGWRYSNYDSNASSTLPDSAYIGDKLYFRTSSSKYLRKMTIRLE